MAGDLTERVACLLADMEGDRGDWVPVPIEGTDLLQNVRRWRAKMPAADRVVAEVLAVMREPSAARERARLEAWRDTRPHKRTSDWLASVVEADLRAFAREHGLEAPQEPVRARGAPAPTPPAPDGRSAASEPQGRPGGPVHHRSAGGRAAATPPDPGETEAMP